MVESKEGKGGGCTSVPHSTAPPSPSLEYCVLALPSALPFAPFPSKSHCTAAVVVARLGAKEKRFWSGWGRLGDLGRDGARPQVKTRVCTGRCADGGVSDTSLSPMRRASPNVDATLPGTTPVSSPPSEKRSPVTASRADTATVAASPATLTARSWLSAGSWSFSHTRACFPSVQPIKTGLGGGEYLKEG